MKKSTFNTDQFLNREQMKKVTAGTGPEFCGEQGQGYVFCGLPTHSIHYYENCCDWGDNVRPECPSNAITWGCMIV